MDKAQLQELLATDEGKAVITELGFMDKTAYESSVAGLTKNRDDIKAEKETLKAKYKEVSEKHDKMINFFKSHENLLDDSGNLLYDELDSIILNKKNNANNPTDKFSELKLKREITEAKNTLNKTLEELERYKSTASDLLIKNKLTECIMKSGDFAPEAAESIVKMLVLESGAKIMNDDKGSLCAITSDGNDVAEWFALWKETPTGKAFRRAQPNIGGGAGGASTTAATKELSKMTPNERLQFKKENPTAYNNMFKPLV